ncbi:MULTISPECIES: hypothetical protein [Paraburkholderia]|uniref:Uncharacterized protein n=1 Tax=Paraburkholderia podalyriae TaxID=1938811 RepID=A0ABR7PQK4_9BURK|nr:hypothetical protein [Paraburkholderia podalyriae]MBC8748534.1 hypothetical protein [Paraburkholderia podalyriae]
MKPITVGLGPYDTGISVCDLGGKLDASSRSPSRKQQPLFPSAYSPDAYDLMVCAYRGDGDKKKRSDEVIDALANEMSDVLEVAIAHDAVVLFADLAQWVIGRRELPETDLARLLRGADVRFEQDADGPGVPSEWQVELRAARERRRKTAGERQQTEQGEQADSVYASASAPPAPVNVTEKTTNSTIRHRLKIRWNTLDTAIEKAIEKAGNDKTPDVFVVLRSMALNEVLPFAGTVKDGALLYTNEKGKVVGLTKDGLDARLRRRRKASLNVNSRR